MFDLQGWGGGVVVESAPAWVALWCQRGCFGVKGGTPCRIQAVEVSLISTEPHVSTYTARARTLCVACDIATHFLADIPHHVFVHVWLVRWHLAYATAPQL